MTTMTDNTRLKALIKKLETTHTLTKAEWVTLIEGRTEELADYLFKRARNIRHRYYGNEVYQRGLIEFTNNCAEDCFYCGIRKSNDNATRYRLSKEEILDCCAQGYELGFRTFVLQGGEDPFFDDDKIVEIVGEIHQKYPDCAITLSIGQKPYESYQRFYEAGAARYLLRHETAGSEHYRRLHHRGEHVSAKARQECLWNLKEIGFEVGTGFMVGSPFQTAENLADDMLFLEQLQPHMVGIGPFIPHKDTPFKDFKAGSLELTLYMIALIRLALPSALLPSTTALGTIAKDGREKGILAGANVVMPNLSPTSVRKNYLLYDNKICIEDDAKHCRACMSNRMRSIGYEVVVSRGDHKKKDEVMA